MVRAGSGADVAGPGFCPAPRPVREAVVHRHRRLELKIHMTEVLDAKAAKTPCCRIGFMYRSPGFRDRIFGAPFDG